MNELFVALSEETKHRESVELTVESDTDGPVAWAELVLKSDTTTGNLYYYISNLDVAEGFQGRGFGSQMIEKVNNFLIDSKLCGVLQNVAGNKNAVYDIRTRQKLDISSFYYRYDWRYFGSGNSEHMVFCHKAAQQISACKKIRD